MTNNWFANGMKLALAIGAVYAVSEYSIEAGRKQDALCEMAQLHVEDLYAKARASVAALPTGAYVEAELFASVSDSKSDRSEADIEAQVERVVNEERRIPAEARQEIKRAEKAVSDACDHYASDYGSSTK
ncbi:hypothetical protein [Pseudomonas fluorescens]|uniref:Uncharacterized protein n=1 Tax=Pseudomonas fluorescens TaxID=294 RepID=A0A5E7C677_PSEFL|nr:hypothetical protein [Pseudomonas fluorescens]VVN91421.1 hypothetical protein PS691_01899 [Pseudomonas fluorescens]